MTRANDLADAGIQIEIFDLLPSISLSRFTFPIEFKHDFNISLFYRNIIAVPSPSLNLSQSEQEELLLEKYLNLIEQYSDSKSRVKDLLKRIAKKELQKRTLSRLPLILNSSCDLGPILLGAKLYALYMNAKRPSPILLDRTTNVELTSKTTYVHSSTGKALSKIADNQSAEYRYAYSFGGEQAVFIWKEFNTGSLKDFGPPALTLLGFKPIERLKPY